MAEAKSTSSLSPHQGVYNFFLKMSQSISHPGDHLELNLGQKNSKAFFSSVQAPW